MNSISSSSVSLGFQLYKKFRCGGSRIIYIAWSPDGQRLAIASQSKNVWFWDLNAKKIQAETLKQDSSIVALAWSPDGRTIASTCKDCLVRLWNTETFQVCREIKLNATSILSAVWSMDGQSINVASISGVYPNALLSFGSWDIQTGQLRNSFQDPTWDKAYPALSTDRGLIALALTNGNMQIWNMKTIQLIDTLSGSHGRIYSVAYSLDKKIIAVALDDGTIQLWNKEDGQKVNGLYDHDKPVYSLSFASDNQLLASKSMDGIVRLWRCDTWEEVVRLKESSVGYEEVELAFHPASSKLATFDDKNTAIRIWKYDIGKLLQAKNVIILPREITDIRSLAQINVDKAEFTGNPTIQSQEVIMSKIEVKLGDNATIYGDFAVANSIENSFNKADTAQISDELKYLLKDLSVAVGKMSEQLPADEGKRIARALEILTDEATNEKPDRKWWSVSVQGLIKAANNIGNIGKPVLDIIAKLVPILEQSSR